MSLLPEESTPVVTNPKDSKAQTIDSCDNHTKSAGIEVFARYLPRLTIQQCVCVGARHIMPTASQRYASAQGRAGVSGKESPAKLQQRVKE